MKAFRSGGFVPPLPEGHAVRFIDEKEVPLVIGRGQVFLRPAGSDEPWQLLGDAESVHVAARCSGKTSKLVAAFFRGRWGLRGGELARRLRRPEPTYLDRMRDTLIGEQRAGQYRQASGKAKRLERLRRHYLRALALELADRYRPAGLSRYVRGK